MSLIQGGGGNNRIRRMEWYQMGFCFSSRRLPYFAGEFEGHLPGMHPGEAEDGGRRRGRIGEDFASAKDDDLRGLFFESLGRFAVGKAGLKRETRPPFDGVGTVKAPDGSAAAGDAPFGTLDGAFFPAVADAGRRVVEKDHELVEARQVAFRHRRLPQPMEQRVQPGNRV